MALPLPNSGQGAGRAVPNLPVVSKREESNDYGNVVAHLSVDWRVIECKDRLQWVVQRRAGVRHGRARWEGRSYFRRRKSLIRACATSPGPIDPTALAILEALPEMIGIGGTL